MNAILRIGCGFMIVGVVFCSLAGDDFSEAVELVRAGNSWKEGEIVPVKLLEYRTSQDDSCFSNPRGTEMMFGQITNYPLLRKIAFRSEVDSHVFSNAVIQAVLTAGPNRFFRDLAATLEQQPKLEKQDKIKLLKKQSEVRHIVVDSLYISFAEMPPNSARKVLGEISLELREGKLWHDVYWKYLEKYKRSYEQKLSDGTIVKGNGSYIGNLGDFILPANKNSLFSYREDWMPKRHVEKLFATKAGEIVILSDRERYVLHRVREVYAGKEMK